MINILTPVIVEFLVGMVGMGSALRGALVYGAVLFLFAGNIYLLQRPSNISWLIGLSLGLNIFAIAILGKISFFTALPSLLPSLTLLFGGGG